MNKEKNLIMKCSVNMNKICGTNLLANFAKALINLATLSTKMALSVYYNYN